MVHSLSIGELCAGIAVLGVKKIIALPNIFENKTERMLSDFYSKALDGLKNKGILIDNFVTGVTMDKEWARLIAVCGYCESVLVARLDEGENYTACYVFRLKNEWVCVAAENEEYTLNSISSDEVSACFIDFFKTANMPETDSFKISINTNIIDKFENDKTTNLFGETDCSEKTKHLVEKVICNKAKKYTLTYLMVERAAGVGSEQIKQQDVVAFAMVEDTLMRISFEYDINRGEEMIFTGLCSSDLLKIIAKETKMITEGRERVDD